MGWFRRAVPAQLLDFEDDVYSFRQRRQMALRVEFQDRSRPSRWVSRLCHGIGLTLVAGLAALIVMIIMAALLGVAGAGELPVVPDPRLTLCAAHPAGPHCVLTIDAAVVCRRGYAKSVRHTPGRVKEAVYRKYGITKEQRLGAHFEVDHLISLELGGADDEANLFPESYDTQPWNARLKDRVEVRLHALVCSGRLPLAEAQRAIATDWTGAYRKYFGPSS